MTSAAAPCPSQLPATSSPGPSSSLDASEERYRRLFDEAIDAIFVANADTGTIVDCNAAAEILLGHDRSTIIGMHQRQLHPSEGSGGETAKFLAHANGSAAQLHAQVVTRTGSLRDVLVKASILELRGQRLIQGIFRDVTDLYKVEQERDKFFRLCKDMVVITDFAGIIRYVNEAVTPLLGYLPKELLETPFAKLVLPEDQLLTTEAMSVLTRGEDVDDFANRYLGKHGEIRWLSWNATPDCEHQLIYAIARDVTDRKHSELLLQQAKDSAEAASRAKSQFLANISHEIRTPLNAIIGLSDHLQSSVADPVLSSHVQTIGSAGRNLMALLNDILDLSKLEAGKMEPNLVPVSLPRLLGEVRQIFSVAVQEKNLRCTVQVAANLPAVLMLDEGRMRQVLVNLMGNAIKFTNSGQISITADAASVAGATDRITLTISVIDTGIGIAQEQQQLLFQSFQQLAGPGAEMGSGTGLGLAISRKLVEMLGGSIKLTSTPGVGSTFTVSIPDVALGPSHQLAAKAPATAKPLPDALRHCEALPPKLRAALAAELARFGQVGRQAVKFGQARQLARKLHRFSKFGNRHAVTLSAFGERLENAAAGYDIRAVRSVVADLKQLCQVES